MRKNIQAPLLMAGLTLTLALPGLAQETEPTAPSEESSAQESQAPPASESASTATSSQQDATDPQPSDAPAPGDWAAWGRESHATRHSPLDQITADNIENLEVAWSYRTGDMPEGDHAESKYAPETTPIKVDDSLYLCSAMNIMISLDARTGEEQWRYDPQVDAGAIPYSASCRGVTYHEIPNAGDEQQCAARIIEGTLDGRLIAVDADTGELCQDFGDGGMVDLWEGIGEKVPGWYSVTAPPTIVQGIIVTGAQVKDGQAEDAPSGVIRGYDAQTGELAWAWDMGRPDLDGAPPEGETYTRGTPNMWTTAASDEELGYVYLPMGNSSVDYFGGNRSEEENEYSTSLVAIDVNSGEPVWHFQTVHYDVWDYDLGSQPSLVDFPQEDGSTVPALILASKQGDIYVLDRRTGESLFPVEEVEAPRGGVEPDNLSETQPSSSYHTLAFPDLEEKDMWGMTPIDQLWCRIQFRRAEYQGMYTPPTSERRFIQYPGYNGGNDWGSVAVDTERGVLIANYNNIPNYNRLLTREEAEERNLQPIYAGGDGSDSEEDGPAEGAGDPQVGAPYAIDVNAGWRAPITGMPCTAPPYGGIRAIDLASGETLWDKPLGEARKNGPFGIPTYLPLTIGTPNNGGPLITGSGLIFIAAATDDLFRAINIENGEVVWKDTLPAGGQANPMTYEVDGRQYVVIAPGGHHFMETPIGDHVIAYALPEDE
ncbi:pyrroloquinoline quinone-dependent dehydrogenase [Litchfieldella xinjiangensis]|uniref:pyrroloquinoline quinone-dependent dehydrogenase n=1 Tax=Litchfieldella xinjiangensis TaxID=1166948 RepID=UPI0005BCF9C2|nr:membrane-bound PQQ-dependent dehydrogenase, glucose/quinate/shikimate family [Halomonas xinjiangensis]